MQRAMPDAEPGGKPLHSARFAGGLWPQSMIDRNGQELRALFQRRALARRQHKQRRGIGTAGHGENESGSMDEVSEQRFRFGG